MMFSLAQPALFSGLSALRPLAFGLFSTGTLTRSLHTNGKTQTSSPTDFFQVGLIGLGSLGTNMARRLLDRGHNLVLYDTNSIALGRVLKEADEVHRGRVHTAGSAAELAGMRNVNVIFTLLPSAAAVREVYLGPSGIVHARHGVVPHVLVDCSTTGPVAAREIARLVAKAPLSKETPHVKGLPNRHPVMVDAPINGSADEAEKGALSFMVGGPDAAVQHVMPLLQEMGKHIIPCGDHGDAQAAKLCSHMVTVASMAAVAEALALGKRLGVEPRALTQVLNAGASRCWASEHYNPVPGVQPSAPASAGYKGGLRSALVADQLDMLVHAAEEVASPAPVSRLNQSLYKKVCDHGMSDADYSAIYRVVYGSGASPDDWAAGEQLFDSHAP